KLNARPSGAIQNYRQSKSGVGAKSLAFYHRRRNPLTELVSHAPGAVRSANAQGFHLPNGEMPAQNLRFPHNPPMPIPPAPRHRYTAAYPVLFYSVTLPLTA